MERVRDYFADAITPHERYAASLLAAGLEDAALTRDWLAAASHALEAPIAITPPHGEDGWLGPEQPAALAFRLPARRGQRLLIEVRLLADTSALIFIDLFTFPTDSLAPPRSLASADSGATALEYEPRRDGEYLLRVQPELLRGGRYTLTIRAEPMLAFPVQGRNLQDIGSVFGDPRDGGRRDHHGVDIFAPRGTPALAAIEATVRRVETTDRGGNVVWLRDERRGLSLYYAHLDRQTVTQGMRLQPGDTVGLIGNTGNARTTPPHLHFGIYQRGPVDPHPFVYRPAGRLEALAVDTMRFGRWSRVARDGLVFRLEPRASGRAGARSDRPSADTGSGAPADAPLDRHTALFVLAGSGSMLRVRLPDGRVGWVAARLTEPADHSIAEATLATGGAVTATPGGDPSSVIERIGAGDRVDVLARFDEYVLVQAATGPMGWVLGS